MTPELLAAALDHAREAAPAEAVGVVIQHADEAVYHRCENQEPGHDYATPSPHDLIMAEDTGRLLGYIHSHPSGPIELSQQDLQSCEATGLPWWVVTLDGGWVRHDPIGRSLLGRQFVLGVDDCWSVCRDWYQRELSIDLPDFLRSQEFWRDGTELHLNHMVEAGFDLIEENGVRRGDAMLFRVAATTITHCAIYLGDGWILHHIEGMLSRKEPLDNRWMRRLAKVARRSHD